MKYNYIAFEGADGTGKTTLSKLFAKKHDAHWTYEPFGDTEITRKLREFCLEGKFKAEVNDKAREYMLLASRAISTHIVAKHLLGQEKVVSDRSLVSGMVYASVASGMRFESWWRIAESAIWTRPKLIVYVVTDKQNINPKDDDIYDHAKEDFHRRIKSAFPLALNYVERFLNIPSVTFTNDFNLIPEENIHRLEKIIGENNGPCFTR